MNSRFGFVFIILCILLQAASGIFGKFAALSTADMSIYFILTNIFYLLSIFCLMFQALFWQQALSYYPLSFAYPFMSLVNFVVLISSCYFFQEGITFNNIVGLTFISIGITLLSRHSGDLL